MKHDHDSELWIQRFFKLSYTYSYKSVTKFLSLTNLYSQTDFFKDKSNIYLYMRTNNII